jgi:HK97 family phage major capsid protein
VLDSGDVALVGDVLGQVIQELVPVSTLMGVAGVVDVPMTRTSTKVVQPTLTPGSVTGGFVEEGKPVPVAQGAITNVEMPPLKKVATILVLSDELFARSGGARTVQNLMVNALASAADSVFLSASATSDAAPAGVFATGVGTTITGATAGTDAEDSQADVLAALNAQAAGNLNPRLSTWSMAPAVFNAMLSMRIAGGLVFPDLAGGMLGGLPVIVSTSAPADTLSLLHGPSIMRAVDMDPMVSLSTDATVHMDTAPAEDLGGVGNPTPVRSFWQTSSTGVLCAIWTQWATVSTAAAIRITPLSWVA